MLCPAQDLGCVFAIYRGGVILLAPTKETSEAPHALALPHFVRAHDGAKGSFSVEKRRYAASVG